jgi:hypothetical protein
LPRVIVPVLSSNRVFTSPAASTARSGHRKARCVNQSVHSGDTNSRKESADRCRDQTDQQRHKHRDGRRRRRGEPGAVIGRSNAVDGIRQQRYKLPAGTQSSGPQAICSTRSRFGVF